MRNSLPQRYLPPFADIKMLFLNIDGLSIGLSTCSRQFYNYDFFKGNSLFIKNVFILFLAVLDLPFFTLYLGFL